MIHTEARDETGTLRLWLVPNRSLSWRGNQQVLVAAGLLAAAPATVLAAHGFWPVLPFSLAAWLLLGAGLYATVLRLCRCEALILNAREIAVQYGRFGVEHEVRYPRAWARLRLEHRVSPCEARLRVFLGCSGRWTEVGAALNENERALLAAKLQALLAPTDLPRTDGEPDSDVDTELELPGGDGYRFPRL